MKNPKMLFNQLVLASGSPRRVELLNQIGCIFKTIIPSINENMDPDPLKRTLINARLKAEAILDQTTKNCIVLGVDTVVIFKKKIYGKPTSMEENIAILSKLSGEKHQVISTIILLTHYKTVYISNYEVTDVFMGNLNQKTILDYVNTHEGLDKAGGYGIQAKGAILIKKIDGCYFNIMGLPLTKFISSLSNLPNVSVNEIIPWLY